MVYLTFFYCKCSSINYQSPWLLIPTVTCFTQGPLTVQTPPSDEDVLVKLHFSLVENELAPLDLKIVMMRCNIMNSKLKKKKNCQKHDWAEPSWSEGCRGPGGEGGERSGLWGDLEQESKGPEHQNFSRSNPRFLHVSFLPHVHTSFISFLFSSQGDIFYTFYIFWENSREL